MALALIFKKVGDFFKKNWKIVGVVLAVLIFTGLLRKLVAKIRLLWTIHKAKKNLDDPSVSVDYEFMAMSVHEGMYTGWFGWAEDEEKITALINTLASQAQFLELCRVYAVKYSKDLREQLRGNFSDGEYSKLLYK